MTDIESAPIEELFRVIVNRVHATFIRTHDDNLALMEMYVDGAIARLKLFQASNPNEKV